MNQGNNRHSSRANIIAFPLALEDVGFYVAKINCMIDVQKSFTKD